MFSPNALIKSFLANRGYDVQLHRIAKQPYHGPNLAFVHIAKSGGISIDQAMREAFAQKKQPRIDRQATLAASMASFTGEINNINSACDFSEHHAKTLSGIFEYYLAQQWSFVSGHVTVNESLLKKYNNDYKFITVLREPKARFISNYVFNKLTNKQAFMLPSKNSEKCLFDEARELIDSRRGIHLAGIPSMCLTGRFANNDTELNEIHQQAKQNLSQFSIVGSLTHLDNFIAQIKHETGRTITIRHLNSRKSLQSPEQQKIQNDLKGFFNEPEIQKKLTELCRFETALYQESLSNMSKGA